MKELLIFDLDGLLLDTERVYHEGWLALFEKYHLPITSADIVAWRGQSWQQTATLLAKKVGGLQRVEELRQEREGYIEDQLLNGNLQPKPFARETLALAREKGLKTTRAGIQVVLIPDQSFTHHFSADEKAGLNLYAETTSLEYVYQLLATEQLTN